MMSAFGKAWDVLKQNLPEKICLQCGGVIPEEGGGPYQSNKLCDCVYPDDPDSYAPDQGDPDREPMLNTWHPEDEQVKRL